MSPRWLDAGCLAAERGAALLLVLLTTTLVAGIATTLIVLSTVDVALSGSYRTAQEVFHAADAGLERSVAELATISDWTPLLAAPPLTPTAPFSDTGAVLRAPDGRVLSLAALLAAVQASGPPGFGADAPAWRVFAHLPLAGLWPSALDGPPVALAIFVADDGSDGDGDPARDSNGRILVRVEAYGLQRSRRSLAASVERVGPGLVRIAAWKEIR